MWKYVGLANEEFIAFYRGNVVEKKQQKRKGGKKEQAQKKKKKTLVISSEEEEEEEETERSTPSRETQRGGSRGGSQERGSRGSQEMEPRREGGSQEVRESGERETREGEGREVYDIEVQGDEHQRSVSEERTPSPPRDEITIPSTSRPSTSQPGTSVPPLPFIQPYNLQETESDNEMDPEEGTDLVFAESDLSGPRGSEEETLEENPGPSSLDKRRTLDNN